MSMDQAIWEDRMNRWQCRHEDNDGDDDWLDFRCFGADDAAIEFARRLDGRDSEAFTCEDHPQIILVRELGRPETVFRFAVTFAYMKSFRARVAAVAA